MNIEAVTFFNVYEDDDVTFAFFDNKVTNIAGFELNSRHSMGLSLCLDIHTRARLLGCCVMKDALNCSHDLDRPR